MPQPSSHISSSGQSAVMEPQSSSAIVTPAPAVARPRRERVVTPKAAFKGTAKTSRFSNGVNWVTTVWMIAMHIGAVAALWHFSWSALVAFAVLHWVSASLGVCLGYHRLLTHAGLVVPKALRYLFTIFGMLSAEGSPLYWVAIHRKHHVLSDQQGDPHSPNDGFWWSHMLWFEPKETPEEEKALFQRWAPDLYGDPVHRFFHKTFILFSVALGFLLFGWGQWLTGNGWPFLLWGLCARMVVCYHCTWLVNSATHVWGYRNYETTDRSRNLWWVALLAYGEGWHNNHHAHQRLARHGHRWFEIDITYMTIWVLKKLGLATHVQDKLPKSQPLSTATR